MRVSHFDQAVANIYAANPSIEKEAYYLLREALDYTCEKSQNNGDENKHVSATQLLNGFREFSLKQYGPMAATLFSEWNITKCADIGEMVFGLIEEGIFSKQESDKRSDFTEIYDFEEVFVHSFLPSKKIASPLSD